jgi:hypothetical protein
MKNFKTHRAERLRKKCRENKLEHIRMFGTKTQRHNRDLAERHAALVENHRREAERLHQEMLNDPRRPDMQSIVNILNKYLIRNDPYYLLEHSIFGSFVPFCSREQFYGLQDADKFIQIYGGH